MTKRTFDITASLTSLILLAPVFVVLAVLIKATSPGPVFYRSVRVGKDGRPFTLYKLRSMVNGAHKNGPGVTGAHDSRITPLGRWLRRTKLDELPQLMNVLKGDMSFVGPRPEDPRYVAFYNEEQCGVLRVRPGITSPASVQYIDEESLLDTSDWETLYIQQVMPAKLKIDLEYVQHQSLRHDLCIMWQTMQAMWR